MGSLVDMLLKLSMRTDSVGTGAPTYTHARA